MEQTRRDGGTEGGSGREEKRTEERRRLTATKLSRGFNQPNYRLITETLNLEQLTHTHTHTHAPLHTHPYTHTWNRLALI